MEQNLLCLHFAQDIYQQRGFCTSPFFYISIYHSYKYLHLANWKSVHMCIFSWRICCCTLLCILVSFKVRIKIRNNVDQRSLPPPPQSEREGVKTQMWWWSCPVLLHHEVCQVEIGFSKSGSIDGSIINVHVYFDMILNAEKKFNHNFHKFT